MPSTDAVACRSSSGRSARPAVASASNRPASRIFRRMVSAAMKFLTCAGASEVRVRFTTRRRACWTTSSTTWSRSFRAATMPDCESARIAPARTSCWLNRPLDARDRASASSTAAAANVLTLRDAASTVATRAGRSAWARCGASATSSRPTLRSHDSSSSAPGLFGRDIAHARRSICCNASTLGAAWCAAVHSAISRARFVSICADRREKGATTAANSLISPSGPIV